MLSLADLTGYLNNLDDICFEDNLSSSKRMIEINLDHFSSDLLDDAWQLSSGPWNETTSPSSSSSSRAKSLRFIQ